MNTNPEVRPVGGLFSSGVYSRRAFIRRDSRYS